MWSEKHYLFKIILCKFCSLFDHAQNQNCVINRSNIKKKCIWKKNLEDSNILCWHTKATKTKKRNLLHTQDICFLLYQANNLRVWIMAMILQKIYISVSTQFCKMPCSELLNSSMVTPQGKYIGMTLIKYIWWLVELSKLFNWWRAWVFEFKWWDFWKLFA